MLKVTAGIILTSQTLAKPLEKVKPQKNFMTNISLCFFSCSLALHKLLVSLAKSFTVKFSETHIV